jgi:predicted DNA-binding antitoxin AbrB/MazE fold protein
MAIVQAIFDNGVFRPINPVVLPNKCRVEFEPRVVNETPSDDMDDIYEILDRRYSSGHTDTAARHNEHQP